MLQLFETLLYRGFINSMFNVICLECNEPFVAERETAKFCRPECRLKNWREKQKSSRKIFHSRCPNCWDDFAHKNHKKKFCTPKCKTAYQRKRQNEREKMDRYLNQHNYFVPPTPDEVINNMLLCAWQSQEDAQNEG